MLFFWIASPQAARNDGRGKTAALLQCLFLCCVSKPHLTTNNKSTLTLISIFNVKPFAGLADDIVDLVET
jgi:hypothetical protein